MCNPVDLSLIFYWLLITHMAHMSGLITRDLTSHVIQFLPGAEIPKCVAGRLLFLLMSSM